MPNIEIKATCADLTHARHIAHTVMTDYIGHLHQVDTYYATKEGRLKVREINDEKAQLIPYYKEYSLGPMKSSYELLPVSDVNNLKNILEKTLGRIAIVDKKREVFLADNIRIHIDTVKDLGDFIEFEAVYKEESQKEQEVHKVNKLMEKFKIEKEHLLDSSYIDYLLEKDDTLKVLYHFENSEFMITEVKRTDIAKTAPVNTRLFWFLYDKRGLALHRMNFFSMNTDGKNEERNFTEGTLLFNLKEANFTFKDGHTIKLDPQDKHIHGLHKVFIHDYIGINL